MYLKQAPQLQCDLFPKCPEMAEDFIQGFRSSKTKLATTTITTTHVPSHIETTHSINVTSGKMAMYLGSTRFYSSTPAVRTVKSPLDFFFFSNLRRIHVPVLKPILCLCSESENNPKVWQRLSGHLGRTFPSMYF